MNWIFTESVTLLTGNCVSLCHWTHVKVWKLAPSCQQITSHCVIELILKHRDFLLHLHWNGNVILMTYPRRRDRRWKQWRNTWSDCHSGCWWTWEARRRCNRWRRDTWRPGWHGTSLQRIHRSVYFFLWVDTQKFYGNRSYYRDMWLVSQRISAAHTITPLHPAHR